MKQIRIGEQMTSALGIGAMSFSDFYGATTDAQSFAILDAAMDAGVRHIDTSNVYGMGRSESVIGAWLQANPNARPGAHDGLHIATKGGINRSGTGAEPFDNSPEHLEAMLDQSLQRLGVDCVDLYYVHRRETARPIEEVTETLAGLVAKGKTRSIGFSEIAPHSLRRAAAVHPVAAVQSEYSPGTRLPELGLIQACADVDTAFVAFSPVLRGLLTDTPVTPERVADNGLLAQIPRFQEPNLSANLGYAERFRALAADMGVPAAGLAVAWCMAQGDHVLPIPGTRSVAHFNELVAGANRSLSAEDLARIAAVLPVGWAHGDRYSEALWRGPEGYC
ncbi:MAG: aldo/keto reductase [Paracoccaceae bacterium]